METWKKKNLFARLIQSECSRKYLNVLFITIDIKQILRTKRRSLNENIHKNIIYYLCNASFIIYIYSFLYIFNIC